MSILLGIDPGNSGALAFLDTTNARMFVADMPTFEYHTTRARVKVDPYSVAGLLDGFDVSHAYMEEVNSSPQMGVVSAFSFGEGKGILMGVIAARQAPLTMVKPAQWKRQMRVPADKKAAVQRASQLLPGLAGEFRGPRGGTLDGRAEAAILALYGAMELGQVPEQPVRCWNI